MISKNPWDGNEAALRFFFSGNPMERRWGSPGFASDAGMILQGRLAYVGEDEKTRGSNGLADFQSQIIHDHHESWDISDISRHEQPSNKQILQPILLIGLIRQKYRDINLNGSIGFAG